MKIQLEVRYSEEDKCYVGKASNIIGECCHGNTAGETMIQLLDIVKYWLQKDQEN